MATVRLNAPTDLVTPNSIYGTIVQATDDMVIVLDPYGYQYNFLGNGFTYAGGYLMSGTLTGFSTFHNGAVLGEAWGISVPATAAANFVLEGNLRALLALALAGNDEFYGSAYNDRIGGYGGNDVFYASLGSNYLDGGAGVDAVVYGQPSSSFFFSMSGGNKFIRTGDSLINDTLVSIERIGFTDGTLAFDEGSAQAYRLYQAAFARTPDKSGLSYWVDSMDDGIALQTVAASFLGSAEFQSLYGASPAATDFVALLYQNVLGRAADQGGYDYWLGRFDGGLSREAALVEFSESGENKANVHAEIIGGIWLDYGVLV